MDTNLRIKQLHATKTMYSTYQTIRSHDPTNYNIHTLSVKFLRVVCKIGCPETSVRNYQYTLRNIPEERKSHLFRGGSLKSRIQVL